MKNFANNYLNVITSKDGDVAEILLYGFIGQEDWWEPTSEYNITDVAFVKALTELEKTHNRINIRINSVGGSIYHGNAIVSAIQRSKTEVHTYNDGLCASMGFGIWIAGKHRHAAKSSTFMVHSPLGGQYGNAKDLRATAEFLDTFAETLTAIAAPAFDLSVASFTKDYFDYSDHWISYTKAQELGIITDTEEYESEAVVEGIQNMSYSEIMNHFMPKTEAKSKSLLGKLAAAFTPKKPISNNSKSIIEMNKEDLKTSFEDKTLSIEAITEVMNEAGFTVTAKTPPPATPPATPPAPNTEPAAATPEPTPPAQPDLAATIAAAVSAVVKPLQDKVDALSAAPGGTITKPAVAAAGDNTDLGDDEPDEYKNLNDFNAKAQASIAAGLTTKIQ